MPFILLLSFGLICGYALYWVFVAGNGQYRIYYRSKHFKQRDHAALKKKAVCWFWIGVGFYSLLFTATFSESVGGTFLFRWALGFLALGHVVAHFQFLRTPSNHYTALQLPMDEDEA
jgi:hypothetical protein